MSGQVRHQMPGGGLIPSGEWQSIETAPQDGAHVLLFDGAYVFEGYWGDRIGRGWYQVEDPHCRVEPTHWMPLPLPPHPIVPA